MKNAMQRRKKHNKTGFTLVELLVVLVILAILAAAIIPSMMGFIDRAKKESIAAEQRSVLLAAQVEVNELYGKGELDTLASPGGTSVTINSTLESGKYLTAIQTVADLPGEIVSVTVTKNAAAGGAGTTAAGNGKDDGHWTITEAKYTDKEGKLTYTYSTTLTDGKLEGTWDDGAE